MSYARIQAGLQNAATTALVGAVVIPSVAALMLASAINSPSANTTLYLMTLDLLCCACPVAMALQLGLSRDTGRSGPCSYFPEDDDDDDCGVKNNHSAPRPQGDEPEDRDEKEDREDQADEELLQGERTGYGFYG